MELQVLHWWEAFFRTGSLIFGGGQVMMILGFQHVYSIASRVAPVCYSLLPPSGPQWSARSTCWPCRPQVVLPMLSTEVVARGWMSEPDFLTGLALIQALPGPLFNLSAYIGGRCTL